MRNLAAATPRRAEMSLALLKRILRNAEERGKPPVDPGVHGVGSLRPTSGSRFFSAGATSTSFRSWMPEYVAQDRAGRRPQPLQAGRASGSSRPRRQLRRRRDLRHRPRRSFWANAYEDSRRAADGRHRAARATAAARTAARANPERSRSSLPDTSRRSIRATQLHGTRVQAGGASGRLSGGPTSDIPAPH